MLQPPFIEQLEKSKCVLIAGAGGGFDVFSGLPLFFALRKKGIAVHLANLSFSFARSRVNGKSRIGPDMVEVTAASDPGEDYFPEAHLCKWFSRKRMDTSIYCVPPLGPSQLLANYQSLQSKLGFDTVVLVDGGIDSILKGDEARIGTPVEDMSSLAAIMKLDVPQKLLLCLGFGAETDVCSVYALETISELIRSKAFLGALALTADMPEVRQFAEATEYVFFEMPRQESVICSSVLSALDGRYGDYHRTRRTAGSRLWINPLMMFYWAFDAAKVAKHVLYFEAIQNAETLKDVTAAIKKFRAENPLRPAPVFPSVPTD